MKRLLPLALLSFLLLPSSAAGDGCPPEQCGVRALSVPGAPTLVVQPYAGAEAYDVTTARRRFATNGPALVAADGRSVLVARNPNGRTRIQRFDAQTGRLLVQRTQPALLALSAVSADGRRAALTEATSYHGTTRLVVLDLATGRTEEANLHGRFEPEAVSNDGHRLFVIQNLRSGYRVRVYDLVRKALRPGELRPVNDDEPMRGTPVYAIGAPDGRWLLTLYVKPDGEGFVHALDLRRAKAYCIDLPDGRAVGQYGLALGPDGRTLVAANPASGTVTQIDLGTVEVSRIAHFPHGSIPNWTNVAFSPRGDLVYFGGLIDLRAYDLRAGRVRGPYDVGALGGLAFTADGRRLLVLRPSGKQAIWLDAATGRRL